MMQEHPKLQKQARYVSSMYLCREAMANCQKAACPLTPVDDPHLVWVSCELREILDEGISRNNLMEKVIEGMDEYTCPDLFFGFCSTTFVGDRYVLLKLARSPE